MRVFFSRDPVKISQNLYLLPPNQIPGYAPAKNDFYILAASDF